MKPKEFFSRWGKGIQAVTPMQSIKVTLIGNIIILIGIILGIVTVSLLHTWWLLIILLGSLIIQGLGFIGSIQKYLVFKNIEMITTEKEVENNDKI